MTTRKAVIPAAGFGMRFLPFTKAVPKELIPLVDKPTLQYVVEEAADSGITDILFVISAGKETIQAHFNPNFDLESRLRETGKLDLLSELERINSLANIHYVHQQILDGLVGAILRAKSFVGDQPFAVLLGDTVTTSDSAPVVSQLLAVAEKRNAPVVALERVAMEKVGRYGVVGGEDLGGGVFQVRSLVEKPVIDEAPSNLAVASRYVFTPDIFKYLENTERGKGGEIQLTDAMAVMLKERDMFGFEFDGVRHDIGNKLEFVKSTILFALKRGDMKREISDFIKTLRLP